MPAGCSFCAIAADPGSVASVHVDDDLMVFLDRMPIREGHAMMIPRVHYDYFDDMPPAYAAAAMGLAQRVARAMKRLYAVERVALVATGTDLPHAHLHLVPMHAKTDITSARYMAGAPVFAHRPHEPKSALDPVAERLASALEDQR